MRPRRQRGWPGLERVSIAALLLFSAGLMVRNAWVHQPEWAYDFAVHIGSARNNESLTDWRPRPLVDQLEYNPPLYYMTASKLNHLFERVSRSAGRAFKANPYFAYRAMHIGIFLCVTGFYTLLLAPRLFARRETRGAFALGLVLIPNTYLASVMMRADHLLLLFVQLLAGFWFFFDFPSHLATSRWRQAVWACALIGMANSRNFALPAFALFLGWGAFLWGRHARGRGRSERLACSVAILVVLALSGQHYVHRWATTGLTVAQRTDLAYYRDYLLKQEGFDRRAMFLNLEFSRLLVGPPNRFAVFSGDNAFLPRLWGDMWADHWLYFSGRPLQELKAAFKRVVLVTGIPFTLLFFGAPVLLIGESLGAAWKRRRFTAPGLPEAGALLFLAALGLLGVFVWNEPEVGKNSTVKFCYLMGYSNLALLPMMRWVDRTEARARAWLAYSVILWLSGLPLYVFWA